MSARAWYYRRNKPPVYLVHVDWWSWQTMLYGPPARARRVELARIRRSEGFIRRQKRKHPRPQPLFPEGWEQLGQIELPWALPDADVSGDIQAMASVQGFLKWPFGGSASRQS